MTFEHSARCADNYEECQRALKLQHDREIAMAIALEIQDGNEEEAEMMVDDYFGIDFENAWTGIDNDREDRG